MTDLYTLEALAGRCTACELHKGRINPVFGKGSVKSDIVVCGMAPAHEENEQGSPFVGKAGQLLDEILVDADISKDDVYITNIVKCLVAPGIKLKYEWVHQCLPYLVVQLSTIKPKVVVLLGTDVSINLLGLQEKTSMASIKNREFIIEGVSRLPTYHPSYLLRGGGKKHRSYEEVVERFRFAKKNVKTMHYFGKYG